MIQIFKRNKKITKLFLLLFFLCCTAFLLIFYIESDKPITKKKQTAAKTTADKPTSISYCVTSLSDEEESTLVYHPTERVLSQFIRKKNQYIRNIWDEKSGWTTNVESWKIKKSETLEHFSYNTNGALYACKKKWSKGKLAKQSIVCLRNNGNIKNINLIHLNNKQNTDEIKDIRCNGTSIAITYQYGNVTIYNLLERLAFGGSSISGMPGENIFYDLHYLTIETKKTTEEIYLRDYDIRSGEVTHTFPLGSFAQKKEDFHITNLGNTLYVLTPRGLFRGECESSSLQKLLAFRELPITTAKQHFNHVFRFCRFSLPRYQRSRRQQIHSAYSSSKPKSFRPKSSRVKSCYTKGLTWLFAGRSVLRILSGLPHGRHIGNGNTCCLLTICLHTDHLSRLLSFHM